MILCRTYRVIPGFVVLLGILGLKSSGQMVPMNNYLYDCTCKPGQVKPTYNECGNGTVAMHVYRRQVNLHELDTT